MHLGHMFNTFTNSTASATACMNNTCCAHAGDALALLGHSQQTQKHSRNSADKFEARLDLSKQKIDHEDIRIRNDMIPGAGKKEPHLPTAIRAAKPNPIHAFLTDDY